MSKGEKVGYKKPPKHTQFKKGRSGNPRGRPKKKEDEIMTLLKKILNEKIPVTIHGEKVEISQYEALMRSILSQATKGHGPSLAQAAKLIAVYDQEVKKTNFRRSPPKFRADYTCPIEAQKAYDRAIKRTHEYMDMYKDD